MSKKDVVAMLLAGGQGSRLGVLTERVAKPAVPFGSRYRIIDFPLSNCTNSGIEAVGVLTQYQPLELNSYVGNGHTWDLDRNSGGVSILPPYQSSSRQDWYKGTANAIFQNLQYIDLYNPSYVLILSGDHIYKMDYSDMLKTHVEKEAACTIAVLEVPWEEASRFGIMTADDQDSITAFEEKPQKPTSNLASMGIYIFNWDTLRRVLIEDEADPDSENDFGKNIIPKLLGEQKKLVAYHFSGYWKDVGTLYSLWEANMDLLNQPQAIDLSDSRWRIYARSMNRPPHYVASQAILEDSLVTDGAVVRGAVYHSVLAANVKVEEGAVIRDSVLMPGAHILKGAKLERCIVGMNTVVGENCQLGGKPEQAITHYQSHLCHGGITVLEDGIRLKDGLAVCADSMISRPKTPEELEWVEPMIEHL